MIEVKGVSKSYHDRVVVDNVSLTLPEGGITSIIGPNGAGKSTLLTMISRLTPMDCGSILVGGCDVSQTPSDQLAKRLSILRQENVLTSRLSVRELVTFGRYPYSKGRPTLEDKQFVDSAIRYLGLEDLQHRFLDQLSGGQRQRAFVAMVICQDTDYVLLDEPLNNLDMKYAVCMMKQLRRAADELGKTIVLVVHDINFASCYSDTIVAMREGRVVITGTPEDIIETDCLNMIYDMDIKVQSINGKRIAVFYS